MYFRQSCRTQQNIMKTQHKISMKKMKTNKIAELVIPLIICIKEYTVKLQYCYVFTKIHIFSN